MRKFLVSMLSILLILSTFTSSTDAAQEEQNAVKTNEELASLALPIVQSYQTESPAGVWTMDESTRFVIPDTDSYKQNARLKEVVELVAAEFLEKEIPANKELKKIYAAESKILPQDIVITLNKDNPITDKSTSNEAYKISIGADGVKIVAASENAALYALRTIQQLMITNNNQLVYGTIIDYPDLAERRIHVDMGRKYFTKDWVIQQIRELSYFKMNAIQLHFSENLGFRIESDYDPAIVSKDGYLTKAEVREIIAEAKKYGINVIPSLDTPGHVEHILKVHPEYGQVDINGNKSPIALDVTNPEAVTYIKGLYSEYMELFKGSTDFHIGGDEYMEFDRAPFTTMYKKVLTDYAKETLGEGYTWKDTLANYINDIAAHVQAGGFKPRIFNDAIYYGETNKNSWEPVEPKQQIVMHDYIGIDFWSQMGWNKSIAKLNTFVDKGHKDIYNMNATFFYYVLRPSMPTDGRAQHSFDYLNQDVRIYNEWTPGKFESNTVPDDSEFIKGATLAIWNDKPDLVGEDVITEDISKELRSLASKSWNTKSNQIADIDQFKANYALLGNVAGFAKGSELPKVQPVSVLVDKANLEQALAEAEKKQEADYTADSWEAFVIALENATNVLENEAATQVEVDEALSKLNAAIDQLAEKAPAAAVDKSKLEQAISKAEKINQNDYTSDSWEKFTKALNEAKSVLQDPSASQTGVDQAISNLDKAVNALVKKSTDDKALEGTNGTNGTSAGQKLPNTASNMFNLVLIGSLLLAIGAVLFLRKRKLN